ASQFSDGRFSTRRFSASQFNDGRFSASLNDFDLKIQTFKKKKNHKIMSCRSIQQQWGIGFQTPYIGKIRVKKPSILGSSGPTSPTMVYWGFKPIANCKNTTTAMGNWSFKLFANCKNTSKEPLKCHFMHLGSSGSASHNNGYW
ncbi:Hypothetical protein FKW44_003501, partial [Caligus rogercresseyi]